MTVVTEFIAANERHVTTFTGGSLPRPPRREVAILTCIDARMDPIKMVGLADGDANVIRNAGGRAHEAIRSLAISQELLGTREIVVIHHTDCGLRAFTDDEIRERLAASLGSAAGEMAARTEFLAFDDIEATLRHDLAMIRSCPMIRPGTPVFGFVYDVTTGHLEPVE